MLTHIFSSAVCAHCRLCCNFRPASAWETPFLEDSLCNKLSAQGIPLRTGADGFRSFALTFHTTSPEETANCPMLDPTGGCTLPRAERPFECRVWPLRLMYTADGELSIGYYSACPALSDTTTRERLTAYAAGELLPVLQDYAHRFPQSIRSYNPAYTTILTLHSRLSSADCLPSGEKPL